MAAQKVDALIDTHGGDYAEIALNEFGVRLETGYLRGKIALIP